MARRPVPATDPLEAFHPRLAEWLRERLGEPTAVQRRAWPVIADGHHLLATAPTGSGKTLTAFLWALDRLLTGAWEAGRVRVLYVSPLKALNTDIRRNLLGPLEELSGRFREAGEPVPEIRVATRSGDTPERERRHMLKSPPEILITTPESLNILLTSRGGRSILGDLETVILDEIHAVADSKRGTHLITAVERLVLLSGEFQRIALSATVRPLERIGRFVGGWLLEPTVEGGEPRYRAREVTLVEGETTKRYRLAVTYPEELSARRRATAEPTPDRGPEGTPPHPLPPLDDEELPPNLWELLAVDLRRRIHTNRSTLIFANSRRLTEKLTRFVNDGERAPLAYAHHGSLSREIRGVVEERLKEGRLAAIVATNSLELGIDVGAVDEVLLIQTPPSIASAVQRIGRAGHRVGEVSRGRLYPIFGRDALDAAVMARSVLAGEIEAVRPIRGALDVLAQVILSMVAAEPWRIDELYAFLRATDPYRELPRRHFDLVLDMLAGRYADSRLRELRPRVLLDRIDGTVRARRGTARLVYTAGGTIPDRGYFHLRLHDDGTRIGELDEEFVWERSVGDIFTLGTQSWRIRQITHQDVLVSPAGGAASLAPFWRAEERDRGFFFSERIGCFLEEAEAQLALPDGRTELAERLAAEHAMAPEAAAQLLDLLERQRAATGVALPGRRHLVLERLEDPSGATDAERIFVHTFWGGRVNRPYAIALASACQRRYGIAPDILHDDDCLLVELPRGSVPVREILSLVAPDEVEEHLRVRLEGTGFFGARFRESAGRALLLPRSGFGRRIPLWVTRQRAKKLLDAVGSYGDFPLVVETWRSCLVDELDLESLRCVLSELEAGEIAVSETVTSRPSPFAANLVWKQTNRLMYEDDTPQAGSGPHLSEGLVRELVFSSELRPDLPAELIERFEAKLARTYPGYAPREPAELLDWLGERVLLGTGELEALLDAVARDAGLARSEVEAWLDLLAERAVRVRWPGPEAVPVVVAVEALPRILTALGRTPEEIELSHLDGSGTPPPRVRTAVAERTRPVAGAAREELLARVLGEWLRFYGPLEPPRIGRAFGLDGATLEATLETLLEEERIVADRFRASAGEREAPLEVCDAENLEILLRLLRAASRPDFEPRELDELPLLLATWQRLAGAAASEPSDLQDALEGLFGYPAPAGLWESDLLPARLDPYYPAWLDALMQDSDLVWIGVGPERLTFALAADLALFPPAARDDGEEEVGRLVPDRRGKFAFGDLLEHSGLAPARLAERLWRLAWQGEMTSTAFAPVRRGVLGRFRAEETDPAPRHRGRRHGGRWRSRRHPAGDWYLLERERPEDELDALDAEELSRERVRQLLARYGVLFRELLDRELPALGWSSVFRSLRLMELAGEVLSGHFFRDVPGPQFIAPAAFRLLRQGLPEDAIYWMNALDPASPCGLGLEAFKGKLPPRLGSTHLVFHGRRRVVVSRRTGAELEIAVEADHPYLLDYLDFLRVLLTRSFDPVGSVDIETINSEPAARSPYARRLAELASLTREREKVRLRKRY